MKIEKNKSLKELTTWKVGGPADFFINAKTENDLKEAILFAKKQDIPFEVIGNGSNILVKDAGYKGLIIKNSYSQIKLIGKNKIECSSGTQLSQLIKFAKDNGLYGIEFLWGIPGTVGGAIIGNAGMNNQGISKILTKIKAINKAGDIINIKRDDIKFSYRNSSLKKNKLLIISAEFKLSIKNNRNTENLPEKRLKQPKGFSAGSVFKNPKKIAAGKLIEEAGLKGKKIGGAQISEMHGNFILNINNARSEDILKLIKLIQEKVLNKFGVQLKREVRLLGERGWE